MQDSHSLRYRLKRHTRCEVPLLDTQIWAIRALNVPNIRCWYLTDQIRYSRRQGQSRRGHYLSSFLSYVQPN